MFTPVALAADYAGTIQVSDRAEVRVRVTQTQTAPGAPAQPPQSGFDADDQAVVVVSADNREWRFSAAYSPQLTLQNVQEGISPQNEPLLLQSATGVAAWHARETRLSLSEAVTYGHFNSAYLFQAGATSATGSPGMIATPTTPVGGASTPAQTQLAPQPTNVYYGSTATTLSLSQTLDRHSLVFVDAGYSAGGGLDPNSRLVDPLAYGPHGDASFSYALSRSLRTVTGAHAEVTAFTASQCFSTSGQATAELCRPEDQIVTVSQGLRDSLSPLTSLSVDAGAAYTRFRTDTGAPFQVTVYPVASAALTEQLGPLGHQTLMLAVTAAPLADLRTGHIDYAVQGSVTLIDRLNPTVTVSVDAAGGQTFPPDDPLAASIVRSDVEARFRADRRGQIVLVLGESELWQDQSALGGFLSFYGYFAVTVATPALRF
jgi:hypothetical protein